MVKTAYVSVKFQDAINNCCLGSAGPKPSIKGMRDKFWDKKAFVLKSGQNAYWVHEEDFWKFYYANMDKT